ncbi:MAG: hypothetical protein C4343_05315 [Chloroflexota bacterium]
MSSRPTSATRVAIGLVAPRRGGPPTATGRAYPAAPGALTSDRPPAPRSRVDRAVVAGAIYHELRSTLGRISGYSESLLHLDLDEVTRRHYLERLASAAASLSEIADQLLDLAAVNPSAPIVRRQPISLGWLAPSSGSPRGCFCRPRRFCDGSAGAPGPSALASSCSTRPCPSSTPTRSGSGSSSGTSSATP